MLLGIVAGTGIAAIWIRRAYIRAGHASEEKVLRADLMHGDLREALNSRDYRKLDDWLVLYSDDASEDLKRHVSNRRDELYVEQNP